MASTKKIPLPNQGSRRSSSGGGRSNLGVPPGGKPKQGAGKSSGGSKSGGGKSRGGSSGGGGGYSYAKSQRKAGTRYLDQVKNLESQVAAIQHALNTDLLARVNTGIANIDLVMQQQKAQLFQEYDLRTTALDDAEKDNEFAHSAGSQNNLDNLLRERYSGISQAMSMGAGETDTLNVMNMSLRNWDANQSEVERSYYDTLTSINSTQNDINVDVKKGLENVEDGANADKEQLWNDYYSARSELYTDLGNLRNQQADYLAQANEYGVGGGGRKGKKAAKAGKIVKSKNLRAPKTPRQPTGRMPHRQNLGATQARLMPAQAYTSDLDMTANMRLAPGTVFDKNIPLPSIGGGGGSSSTSRPTATSRPTVSRTSSASVRANNTRIQKNLGAGNAKKKRGPKKRKGKNGGPAGSLLQAPKTMEAANKQASESFMSASLESGKAWTNPGYSPEVANWAGRGKREGKSNLSNRAMLAPRTSIKRPDGAGLRRL